MDKAQLICKAKLAEQAERYDDMAQCMNAATKAGPQLNSEERNLLSVAYKNVVGARRSAYRILSSLERKGSDAIANEYLKTVEDELKDTCHQVLVSVSISSSSLLFVYFI